jgi:hypothetical protein
MAEVFIRSFVIGSTAYNCFYDPETRDNYVNVSGPDPELDEVTEEQLGMPSGEEITSLCFEGNKHFIYASLITPFTYVTIDYNVAECGFIPAPSCDLAVSEVAVEDESYIGNYDGSIKVTASSSNSPIKYSLDNVTWQLQNEFVGLVKGVYILYVKDNVGCTHSEVVSVNRTNETIAPTSSGGFPWKERICYFFKLVIEDTEHLVREPIKWDAVGIVGERDKDWHGWNHQYSDGEVQLEFDCDAGKDLIEEQYSLYGNDAEVILKYGFTYGSSEFVLFEGKLNFNTRKNLFGRVALSVDRKDFSDLLQSRFETKVSMKATETLDGEPIISPQPFDVILHSKKFISRLSLSIDNSTQTDWISYVDNGDIYFLPDTSNPVLSEISTYFGYGLNASDLNPVANSLYNLKLDFDGVVTFSEIKSTLYIDLQRKATTTADSDDYTIKPFFKVIRAGVEFYSQQIGPTVNGHWNDQTASINSQSKVLVIDDSIPALDLKKDDEVYIYAFYDASIEGKHKARVRAENTSIVAESFESAPESTSKMWLLHDVINHLLKVTTNNQGRLSSQLLATLNNLNAKDGEFSLYAITNGFNIRNFDADQKPLNISLKTALNSTKSIASIGFGFEQRGLREEVRVEKLGFFYQDNEILVISPNYNNKESIETYEEEVAKDLIYNELEIGYNKYKEDGHNTLDEFNTKHERLAPIKSHKNKFIAKSDFIASGYSLEDSRRQQYADTPTDSYENDEEPFIVALRRDGSDFRAERAEAFQTVDNLISPETAYNLRISPLRMFLNWAKWLVGSWAFKSESDEVKNTFVDKNGALTTQFLPTEENPMGDVNKDLWEEKQHVAIDDLNTDGYIYRPEWMNLKCRLSPDQVLLINEAMRGASSPTKNYGYITVKNPEGEYIAGWPYKLTYNFSEERCEMKLLKRFDNPVTPIGECCPWLKINDCLVLINGEKVILS